MGNVHSECVDRHPPERAALLFGDERWTFGDVREASARMAALLRREHDVRAGDRVAIVLPQRPETALLHVACSRLGAIGVPLSPLFGPDGLRARLQDAAPKLVVTGPMPWRDEPPLPAREEARPGDDDPAFLFYTSGTTGHPKGALLPHRVIAGRMPGFRIGHPDVDVFWSPADWSWIGGLHDALFAPWHAGAAVLAHERRGRFDPAEAYRLLARATDAFLPPTALKAMMRAGGPPPKLALRAVHSAGEPLPPPVRAWAEKALACPVTEVYGLTECAYLVGGPAPDGSMGRPFPGHRVVLRDDETEADRGRRGPSRTPREIGEICVRHGDPTMMLGYWGGEGSAPDLPLDDEGLLHTGDLAREEDGFLHYLGRRDNLIKTSGYRVGPAEVEAALLRHPAVAECAVVGVPDAERGQRVKAFVKRAAPVDAEELMAFVKARLAAHAYPREVEFVDELPTTVSGKLVRRRLR